MKLLGSVFLAIAVLIVATSATIAGDEASQGDIVINEFMPDPAGSISDTNGEWIEIVNTTGSTINIDGWTLKDDDLDSHVIDNGGTLSVAPGAYVVLCRNRSQSVNGGISCDYQYSSFTLTNGGDEVVLKDPSGDEIARRNYTASSAGKSWFYVPSAQPPTGGYYNDQQDGARWARTDNVVANEYAASNYGTPGGKNTQTGEGSTPTAITFRSLAVRGVSQPLTEPSKLLSVVWLLLFAAVLTILKLRRPTQ